MSYCFRVKCLLAIELPLFSKILQTKHHSREFSERHLIFARVVALGTFKRNSYLSCITSLVSFELRFLLIKNLQAEYRKILSLWKSELKVISANFFKESIESQ